MAGRASSAGGRCPILHGVGGFTAKFVYSFAKKENANTNAQTAHANHTHNPNENCDKPGRATMGASAHASQTPSSRCLCTVLAAPELVALSSAEDLSQICSVRPGRRVRESMRAPERRTANASALRPAISLAESYFILR